MDATDFRLLSGTATRPENPANLRLADPQALPEAQQRKTLSIWDYHLTAREEKNEYLQYFPDYGNTQDAFELSERAFSVPETLPNSEGTAGMYD